MSGAWVVVDLFLGDSGKGATVDFLAEQEDADLVVRFNGGAQAGHNVVVGGVHHTFAQWGCGTLRGVPTVLGPEFIVHPTALLIEGQHLARAGVADPFTLLRIDPNALVVTPFQVAAGRLRELSRARPHGTCGVGIGEAQGDALKHDDTVRVRDLFQPHRLRRLLRRQQERKRLDDFHASDPRALSELQFLNATDAVQRIVHGFHAATERLQVADARELIKHSRCPIFEGAQGVLLDQDHGLHPHTTWSDCTAGGAHRLLGERPSTTLGVLRAYATRHGAGPLPTHDPDWDTLAEPHNDDDGWQGRFRRGPLDLPLLQYAARACPVDGLVINHLDVPLPHKRIAVAYDAGMPTGRWTAADVSATRPVLQPADDVAQVVSTALECPVSIEGRGPTSQDRRWRSRP